MAQQHFTVTDDQYVTPELLIWATTGGEGSCAPMDSVKFQGRTPEFPLFSFLHVFKDADWETCNCQLQEDEVHTHIPVRQCTTPQLPARNSLQLLQNLQGTVAR